MMKSIVSANDCARQSPRKRYFEGLPDKISACEIVRESFLQSRSPNTTTRSLSPVTGVRPAAFRRMCDVCEEYDGMDEEAGRGRGGTHSRGRKGKDGHGVAVDKRTTPPASDHVPIT